MKIKQKIIDILLISLALTTMIYAEQTDLSAESNKSVDVQIYPVKFQKIIQHLEEYGVPNSNNQLVYTYPKFNVSINQSTADQITFTDFRGDFHNNQIEAVDILWQISDDTYKVTIWQSPLLSNETLEINATRDFIRSLLNSTIQNANRLVHINITDIASNEDLDLYQQFLFLVQAIPPINTKNCALEADLNDMPNHTFGHGIVCHPENFYTGLYTTTFSSMPANIYPIDFYTNMYFQISDNRLLTLTSSDEQNRFRIADSLDKKTWHLLMKIDDLKQNNLTDDLFLLDESIKKGVTWAQSMLLDRNAIETIKEALDIFQQDETPILVNTINSEEIIIEVTNPVAISQEENITQMTTNIHVFLLKIGDHEVLITQDSDIAFLKPPATDSSINGEIFSQYLQQFQLKYQ